MTRPLSNINLAMNADRGGEVIPFDPEDGGTLTVWYDISDGTAITVDTVPTPDVITNIENKAAADTTNDAELDQLGTGSAGFEFQDAEFGTLDAGFADDIPKRAMIVGDNTQTFTRPGTGGFRVFFVMKTAVDEAIVSVPWTNGIRTNEGGGMNFTINFPAVGDIRWTLEDILTSGHAIGQQVVLAANNDVMDGNPHVIMLGRSVGTGAGGVDQMIGSVDGVVPTGMPFDLDAGFGSVDNTGAVNAVTGWMIWGAFGLVPTSPDTHTRASFGELFFYKTDMSAAQEAAVVAHLSAKWGV